MLPSEAAAEAEIINRIGIAAWNVQQFQKWAIDNMFAFFKDLVAPPAVVTPPNGTPSTPQIVTKDNFIEMVNASLFEHFHLLDTNGDGVPEFHGK